MVHTVHVQIKIFDLRFPYHIILVDIRNELIFNLCSEADTPKNKLHGTSLSQNQY